MSIEESRIRGIAQRALALFMAIVLATTLTPGLALAGEQSASDSSTKTEQAAPTNNETPGDSSNEQGGAASDNSNDGQDSGSSADQNDASAGNTAASNGTTANSLESKGKSANNESNSQANTVSATLVIKTHIGAPISESFTIEKGKTVEGLLNLAVEQGVIAGYTHGTPYAGYTSYYINSITIGETEYAPTSDTGFYWASSINGQWDGTGINETTINEDGFSYELDYTTWMSPDTTQYPVNNSASHDDKAAASDTTAVIDSDGNTSTVASAPTSSSDASLKWKKNFGPAYNTSFSEVLTIGNSIYIVSSVYGEGAATLHRLNSEGKEIASLQLFGPIDYTCRMVYTGGIIIIPLSNGRLQGVSAEEMETMWVSDAIASGAQNISTVTASGGMVFTGTVNSFGPNVAATGTFFAVNALTGKRVWANEETTTGFYWAGACKVGNVLVYGNDAGALKAVDPATGKTVSTLNLSSPIRSTVITNSAGTKAYVVTKDGTLHQITVDINGSLSEASSINFAAESTSTATLFEGNLFVGGCAADYSGSLSVVDTATMQVKQSVSLPYEVKSTPLVAKAADGKTYAYFTCNGAEGDYPNYTSGGGAWVYCLETNTATKLFDATGDLANWCIKSITMGSDGTLYWTNDSGTLFALASASSSDDRDDQDKGKGDGQSGNNGDKDDQSKNGGNNSGSDDDKSGGNGSPAKKSGGKSVAAKTPLSVSKASANAGTNGSHKNSEPAQGTSASASSTKSTSSDDEGGNESQQIPWLPIAGIVVGCVGLVGVGTYLLRRRNL